MLAEAIRPVSLLTLNVYITAGAVSLFTLNLNIAGAWVQGRFQLERISCIAYLPPFAVQYEFQKSLAQNVHEIEILNMARIPITGNYKLLSYEIAISRR